MIPMLQMLQQKYEESDERTQKVPLNRDVP
jgi:hypothetical protein